MSKPTQAEAIRTVAPILWRIQQRLERERRDNEPRSEAS